MHGGVLGSHTYNFSKRIWWLIVSKALEKSKKIPHVIF